VAAGRVSVAAVGSAGATLMLAISIWSAITAAAAASTACGPRRGNSAVAGSASTAASTPLSSAGTAATDAAARSSGAQPAPPAPHGEMLTPSATAATPTIPDAVTTASPAATPYALNLDAAIPGQPRSRTGYGPNLTHNRADSLAPGGRQCGSPCRPSPHCDYLRQLPPLPAVAYPRLRHLRLDCILTT